MSRISRRHFLQFAGSTITTLELSQLDIINKGNRYAQVLAQNTPRKLALLVGINDYPANERFLRNLEGCVTDVALQEELLVHRFGFNPSDIVKLTSNQAPAQQPTRNNILTAFEEHLIKQAKPGDVVVFHFSGHGSRLRDPNPIQGCANQAFNDEFNSTLVVADEGQKDLAPDIMGRTLFLLMSALNTENVTVVLDSCHSGGGTRGNFRVRSVPGDKLNPSPEEIAYQKGWMERLQLSESELARRRCAGVAKGVVFASAQREEEALDAEFDGFSAGAFTYLMTQYLWQKTDTVGSAIVQITTGINSLSSQVPLADGDPKKPVYFINKQLPPTDAVITKVEGDKATLWLGGVDSESLEAFQPGATFAIVDDKGQTSGKLQLISPRSGLRGEAKLVDKATNTSLKPGTLLQEASRVVPADLKLSIGLDPSLAGETNAAKQELSAINRIAAVPAQSGNVPYPGGVQYIFSRMTADYQQKLQKQGANLPAVGSIGLFTEGLELVPKSFGEPGESVTAAVERLAAKLKSLLAVRIIKKTLNADSSQLSIEVSMNLVEQPNQTLARTSSRGRNTRQELEQTYANKLPVNQLFQFRVTNHEPSDLYLTTLLIDSTGGLVVVFPYQWPASNETMKLRPNQTQLIGDPQQMKLRAIATGTGEALVIVSRSPLERAVKTLASLAAELNQDRGALELKEPVEVMGDLLDDLSSDRGGIAVEAIPMNTSEMATLSIAFEVSD
ncbi:caspase family protein [Coleofasciculus sp. FACHB-542]|uniref:caspase family protein n=1 Tax=Coleofasciculus sp. FACHB-542 TaxID=2692787 RepID=UPI001687297C|nr:caspase family protein [Coleofasciculus sp. FACHB-542]MBD2088254.1 caspase family protein [Coleofasciculus sp. FACHB-542]